MASQQKIIIVAGATGNVGKHVVQALLKKPNVHTKIIVRDAGKAAAVFGEDVSKLELIQDTDSVEGLAKAFAGAYTVVSTLAGDMATWHAKEEVLLRAALAAGAKRFVVSDFGVDLNVLPPGVVGFLDAKKGGILKLRELASQLAPRAEIVGVTTGMFLTPFTFSSIFNVNVKEGTANEWGSPSYEMPVTAVEDIGAFTAEAAADSSPVPAHLRIASDFASAEKIASKYNAAFRDRKPLTAGSLGDEAALDAEIAKVAAANPGNFYAILGLLLSRIFVRGVKFYTASEADNSRYPSVHFSNLATFIGAGGLQGQ